MTTHHNYIDGRFDDADVASRIEVFNPATHALLDTVPEAGVAAVERAIAAARTAQPQWAKLPAIQRPQPPPAAQTEVTSYEAERKRDYVVVDHADASSSSTANPTPETAVRPAPKRRRTADGIASTDAGAPPPPNYPPPATATGPADEEALERTRDAAAVEELL